MGFSFTSDAFAYPKSLEVWFLSTPQGISFNSIKYSSQLAQSPYKCLKMGDYCFDPQIGLFHPDDINAVEAPPGDGLDMHELPQIPTATSIDRTMIHCDRDQYFDVFCGKSKKKEKKNSSKLQVWIDVSSSFRAIDSRDSQYSCHRKSFVDFLKQSCKKEPQISIFDTSIRRMGGVSSVCTHRGLNDTKRIVRWIKTSMANKLIIITDINEYNTELESFVRESKGKLMGHKVGAPIYATDLVNKVAGLSPFCK